jgi:hypothetical protein
MTHHLATAGLRLLVVLTASLLAAACTMVRSNVAVTHTMAATASARTVAIVPYTENLAAAPDFRESVAKLAAHLEAKGYDVVAAQGGPPPDYLAYFLYRIDTGSPVNRIASSPYPPTGSIVSYGPRTTFGPPTGRVYRRSVRLEILDRARFRANDPASFMDARVYSGAVTSEGACSSLESVIDPMLMALFADFPGESGRLTTVDIPADSTCSLDRFG